MPEGPDSSITADSLTGGASQRLFLSGRTTEMPGNLATTSSKAPPSFDSPQKQGLVELFSICQMDNRDQIFL